MKAITALFLSVFIIILSPSANSHVLNVPENYPTITAALEGAQPGDTIAVGPGEYRERVLIDKPVSLFGSQGPYHTVINSTGFGHGSQSHVIRAVANCEISCFTLESSDLYTFGVFVDGRYGNARSVSVANCIMADLTYSGIAALDCTLTVKNNLMTGNAQTAVIVQNTSATITNNTMTYNGISCYRGSDVRVMNNIVSNIYAADSSIVDRTYNNVEFNAEPQHNEISLPSLFIEDSLDDYHLHPSSPCIDAGNPDPAYNDSDSTRNDIGAFGGPGNLLLEFARGDMDANGQISLSDLSLLIAYYFFYGECPKPLAVGDINCDGNLGLTDVVLLAQFLFRSGDPPCDQ